MTLDEKRDVWLTTVIIAIVVLISALVFAFIVTIGRAEAMDDGRYANSPLKPWFDSLKSGRGPCCSDADGSALSDTDWETARDGHYRVFIMGEWWDVPDEAVLKEPNRAGRTMVWPVYTHDLQGKLKIEVRCFIPGVMT